MARLISTLWRNLRVWIIKILSKGLENKERDNTNAIIAFKEKFSHPGLDCPRCGVLIPMDFSMLLSNKPIKCQNCNLKLEVNSEESKDSIKALNKVLKEKKNLEGFKHVKQ
jgi:transcription elongation factor Elf1